MQHFYVHFDGDPSLTLKFLLQENQQKTFKEILENFIKSYNEKYKEKKTIRFK